MIGWYGLVAPAGMAYAVAAGLPPVTGLYATIEKVEGTDIWVKLGGCLVKARRTAVASLAHEAENQPK